MDGALDIAASGIAAASRIMQITAENVANAQTPDYQSQQVNLVSATGGGVDVANIESGGTVDLTAQTVEFERAKFLYDANAAVIAAQEQMFGSLVNMVDNDPPQSPS